MTGTRVRILAGGALVLAAAAAITVVVVATSSPGSGSPAVRGATAAGPGYRYYRSMMGRYLGSGMMSGAPYRWMMSPAGYKWMTGGGAVPGWMHSTHLPGAMMGSGSMMGSGARGWARSMMGAGSDPGKIMGRLWASAPGPRVPPGQAAQLSNQVPAGARVNRAANTITFSASTVHLIVVASPAGGPDETFRSAGMTNPAITVPPGSRISVEVVNADPDMAHGLVITAGSGLSSWMPMMTASPAFPGAALWFLGDPTTAGMHAGTLSFTAATAGTYHYLCPVPGHAQKGMTGTFVVTGSG